MKIVIPSGLTQSHFLGLGQTSLVESTVCFPSPQWRLYSNGDMTLGRLAWLALFGAVVESSWKRGSEDCKRRERETG